MCSPQTLKTDCKSSDSYKRLSFTLSVIRRVLALLLKASLQLRPYFGCSHCSNMRGDMHAEDSSLLLK